MAIEWDKNTLLLLHGETLDDSSFYTVPITNNGVKVSTSQSKFGGKSLYFDGSSYIYISVSDFGIDLNSDWSFDWWEYQDSRTITDSAVFCESTGEYGFVVGSPNKGHVRIFSGNSDWTYIPVTNIGNDIKNAWVHRAICKKNETIFAFENGNIISKVQSSGSFIRGGEFLIGYRNTDTRSGGFFGYLDEVRVSNVARWIDNFLPPSEPYKPYTESEVPEPEPGDEPVDSSEFSSKLNWSVNDYLNYDDLNRIERNCKILNDKLRDCGYIIPIDFRKWSIGEYPTPTQLERIRSNINALQEAWFAVPEWRELMAVHRPDGRESINAEQVNAQEWDLQQMYDHLYAMVKAFELKQAGTPFMIAGGIYNAG